MADTGPAPSRLLTRTAILTDPLVRELLTGRFVAVLATIGRRGVPHLTPVWVADGGDVILMATASASRKVRNLERDARGSLVIHDSRAGFEVCGVSIEGRVTVVGGTEAASLVGLVHGRYVDSAAARLPEASAFLASDDVALRLVPQRAWTWDHRFSAASNALRAAGGALPLEPTSPRDPT